MFLFVYKKSSNDEVHVNTTKLMSHLCFRFFIFFQRKHDVVLRRFVDSMLSNFNILRALEIKVNKKIHRSAYGKKMSKIILNILTKMTMFHLS